jgi:hypothetical protein
MTIGDQAGYCRRLASEHYRGFLGCHDITAAWLNLIEKCLQIARKNNEVANQPCRLTQNADLTLQESADERNSLFHTSARLAQGPPHRDTPCVMF